MGEGRASRKPSAEARTISLFSGQTDIEGGPAARDGIMPVQTGMGRMAKPVSWVAVNGFTWALGDKDSGTTIERRGPGVYEVTFAGQPVGAFPCMLSARQAVEERL